MRGSPYRKIVEDSPRGVSASRPAPFRDIVLRQSPLRRSSISRMRVVCVSLIGVLSIAVMGFAQTSAALEPGVHVDPGSPAAKQYALPLDQARQTGSSSSSSKALFGAGIKPRGPGGQVRPGSRLNSDIRRGGRPSNSRPSGPASSALLPSAELRSETSSGNSNSTLVLFAGGGCVLLLGGLLGIALRRTRPDAAVRQRL